MSSLRSAWGERVAARTQIAYNTSCPAVWKQSGQIHFLGESVRSGDARIAEAVRPVARLPLAAAGCSEAFPCPRSSHSTGADAGSSRDELGGGGIFTCRYFNNPKEKKTFEVERPARLILHLGNNFIIPVSLFFFPLRTAVALSSGLTGSCRLHGGMSAWLAPGEQKLWCPHA